MSSYRSTSRRLLTLRWRALLTAVVVAVPAFAVYMTTLMPDVGYWDTAEFQAVGSVLGIAHPTGYPAYTLLLWLASIVLQPLGNPAFRADMLSALLVAVACGVVGATVTYMTRRMVVGLGIGLALALSTQVWAIGLHADPHAFHLFLTSVLVLLLVVWADRQGAGAPNANRLLIAAAALFGVSLANHALTLLLAPGIAVYVLFAYPGILGRLRLIATCVVALTLTTVVLYAYLPIRSAMNPPMDYANPQTLGNFLYVVFGAQFTGTFHARPSITETLTIVASYTWQQLGLLFPLALLGIVVGLARRAALTVMLILWFGMTWFFAIGYDNADIGRYYLVPLLCVAIVAGLGAGAILEAAKGILWRLAPASRTVGRIGIAALMAVVLVVPAAASTPGRVPALDESAVSTSSRPWITSLAQTLPPDSVVVSWWSLSTAFWYAQYIDDWRPDVTVIDDRTILDQNLGSAGQVIDSYLGKRPVFLLRIPYEYGPYRQRYVLEPLPGVNGETIYRVTGYQPLGTRAATVRPTTSPNL